MLRTHYLLILGAQATQDVLDAKATPYCEQKRLCTARQGTQQITLSPVKPMDCSGESADWPYE